MKLLKELTMEEMVQTLQEKSIKYNCRITGFEVYKDCYLNYTKNDVCISWWDYRGRQKPQYEIIRCYSEEEQEEVYSRWWQAVEIAGGKTKKEYEREEEEEAKRDREWKESKEKKELDEWFRALGM